MEDDFSVYFKNEPSAYVWLPLTKLRTDYVCVEVLGYPAEGQSRLAFWVASDGVRTLLYFSSGLAEVVQNNQVSIARVYKALEIKVHEGRLLYMMDEGSEWKDLGPVTKEGVKEGDTSFDSMRRAHLRNKEEALDLEEKAQLKKALKHGFWGKGSSF